MRRLQFGPAKEAQIARVMAATTVEMMAAICLPDGDRASAFPTISESRSAARVRQEFELLYRISLSPTMKKQSA